MGRRRRPNGERVALERAALVALVDALTLVRSQAPGGGQCVGAVRLVIEALELLGVEAEPLPVTVSISGDDGTVGRTRGGGSPDAWGGHLVAHVPGARAIIDPTADQFSRPGTRIGPFTTEVPVDFTDGGVVKVRFPGATGQWSAAPDDTAWRESEGWKVDEAKERAARALASHVVEHLSRPRAEGA